MVTSACALERSGRKRWSTEATNQLGSRRTATLLRTTVVLQTRIDTAHKRYEVGGLWAVRWKVRGANSCKHGCDGDGNWSSFTFALETMMIVKYLPRVEQRLPNGPQSRCTPHITCCRRAVPFVPAFVAAVEEEAYTGAAGCDLAYGNGVFGRTGDRGKKRTETRRAVPEGRKSYGIPLERDLRHFLEASCGRVREIQYCLLLFPWTPISTVSAGTAYICQELPFRQPASFNFIVPANTKLPSYHKAFTTILTARTYCAYVTPKRSKTYIRAPPIPQVAASYMFIQVLVAYGTEPS
ncbi:hypothetical protein BC830DRAFT_678597 [Chytriomyces sp. MP71]|nr:hypothetical protein BC830DRAFT_678597 [Chytriomyces sp. MP71]